MPMRGYKAVFRSGPEDRVTEWINERVQAIRLCLESHLPEAAITLIYSGIDTIGLLDAPAGQLYATQESFLNWTERYVVPLLRTIDGATASPKASSTVARTTVFHYKGRDADPQKVGR